MKKLLLSTAILASALLMSCESAVSSQSTVKDQLSKQELPSEEMLTVTTSDLNEAIFTKKLFMERMFKKMDFSNLDLNNDIVITRKEPVKWEEFDSDGKYLCTTSWKSKRIIFYRPLRTWVLETSERTGEDTCQKEDEFKAYFDLRGFDSVSKEDFKKTFSNAALKTQERLIKDGGEIQEMHSKKMTFTETDRGFTAMVANENLGLEAGSITNAWNIYKMYEDSYEVTELKNDDPSLNMKIHQYAISETPFVSNYSKIFSFLTISNVNYLETSKGILLKDLIKR